MEFLEAAAIGVLLLPAGTPVQPSSELSEDHKQSGALLCLLLSTLVMV